MMGRLSKIAGKQVTVTVDDNVNPAQVSHLSQGTVPAVELHIIDKRKISPDQRKMYFMTLCRKHHQYQHQVGIQAFCQQYHIKPLKLSDEDLLRFKILTNQELQKLQENDRD